MKKLHAILIVAILLCLIYGCATSTIPARIKDPFTETIYLLQKNHINNYEMKELVFQALSHIEKIIDEDKLDIKKLEIDWEKPNDSNDYISVAQNAYDYYMVNAGSYAKKLHYGSLKKLLNGLDDKSTYLTPSTFELLVESKDTGGIGIVVINDKGYYQVKNTLLNSPAEKAGIKSGDKIIQIDDKLVHGLDINEIRALLRGPLNSVVNISIERNKSDQYYSFEIKRKYIEKHTVKYELITPKIAYIKIDEFQLKTNKDMKNKLDSIKRIEGLILDLRDNQGGLLKSAIEVSGSFLNSGLIVWVVSGLHSSHDLKTSLSFFNRSIYN